jgi:hypothetical protein
MTPGNISWIIGDACPSTPMPAVTFRHSTTHNSQNCGVLIARAAVTLLFVTKRRGLSGATQRAGRHPRGGTRTMNAPHIMKAKYSNPITTNVGATPTDVAFLKCAISIVESGDAIIAPPPKPMIANPVAIPGRSGNHRISVETGEMYPRPRPIPPSTP